MKTISLLPLVGTFAENKDIARDIRQQHILPSLEKGGSVVLDFEGISSATQSFIHALVSDLIRKYDIDIFDMILFKNCSETIQEVINIVADYMLESDK